MQIDELNTDDALKSKLSPELLALLERIGDPETPPPNTTRDMESTGDPLLGQETAESALGGSDDIYWSELENVLEENGISVDTDTIAGGETFNRVLEFLAGGKPLNAETLGSLIDQGVVEIEDGVMAIDLSKATPEQLGQLVTEISLIGQGKTMNGGINVLSDADRSQLQEYMVKKILPDVSGENYAQIAASVGNGDEILDTTELLEAIDMGFLEVTPTGIRPGKQLAALNMFGGQTHTMNFDQALAEFKENGYTFAEDTPVRERFLPFVLQGALGQDGINADGMKKLMDQGVITVDPDTKEISIDWTKANPEQVKNLIDTVNGLGDGTTFAEEFNAASQELRDEIEVELEAALNIELANGVDVPGFIDREIGDGDGILSGDEFNQAIEEGYIEKTATGFTFGVKSHEPIIENRSRLLSELESMATDIHDQTALVGGSENSDNNAIDSVTQFSKDLVRFGKKFKELMESSNGLPLSDVEKERVGDTLSLVKDEVKAGLGQLIELAQTHSSNVSSDSPVKPPFNPLLLVATILGAVAQFPNAGAVGAGLMGGANAPDIIFGGAVGLGAPAAGLGLANQFERDPSMVEDLIHDTLGSDFPDVFNESMEGFGGIGDFLRENGMEEEAAEFEQMIEGVGEIGEAVWEETMAANALSQLTQNPLSFDYSQDSDKYVNNGDYVGPDGGSLLKIDANAINDEGGEESIGHLIDLERAGWEVTVVIDGVAFKPSEAADAMRAAVKKRQDAPPNAMGERNDTVSVDIHITRNNNNGVTNDDTGDRIITSGENGSSSLSKLRDEVNEKFALTFTDKDLLLSRALGY